MEQFNDPWKTNLKTGEISLFPTDYFNKYLDHNPAYINVECRSLIGYWPNSKIAVITFNEQDKTMLSILGGDSIKFKKNNLHFVKEIHNRVCETTDLVEWGCGTYTPYHRVFGELTKPAKQKLCMPRYAKTAKFYSVRKSNIPLDQIHDIRFMPYWRNELSDIYEFRSIDRVVESHYETVD